MYLSKWKEKARESKRLIYTFILVFLGYWVLAQKGLDISKISLNSFIARDKNKITYYQPYITNIIKYDEVEQPNRNWRHMDKMYLKE